MSQSEGGRPVFSREQKGVGMLHPEQSAVVREGASQDSLPVCPVRRRSRIQGESPSLCVTEHNFMEE